MPEINKDCPCTNVTCERHGICEECKAFHHANGGLTTCEKAKQEATATN